MSNRVSRWVLVVVMVQAAVVLKTGFSATANSRNGLDILEDFLKNDPSNLCHYVTCQEPVSRDACPNGSRYMEGASQFGCCGACVAFRQLNDMCTGTIDPSEEGGYSKDQQQSTTSLMASIHNATDNVLDSLWCDYGYICYKSKCRKGQSKDDCRNMLNLYSEETKNTTIYKHYRDDYRWEPNCTADGKFEPKQCIGPKSQQRCTCMDPYGNRIFGLVFPEQEELFDSMNCKCSRQAWEKKQAGESSVTLHCLENGNFEPLQCEDNWCYCIDQGTGEPYGSRLPEKAMHLLPCYNKTMIGEQYLRRCESESHAHAKLLDAMAEGGMQGPQTFATCDQDGSYHSRLCDPLMCRCKDKYNVTALSYPSGEDCQCARDRQYYTDTNSKVTVTCKVNTGAYEEKQQQTTFKYCVDEDGIRSGPLVYNNPQYVLDCGQSKLCQEKGASGVENHCALACVDTTTLGECPQEAYPYFDISETSNNI